jgi:hypothetical protein
LGLTGNDIIDLVFNSQESIQGIKRGEAPLRNPIPSPLRKGRGIKGEGLVKNSERSSIFLVLEIGKD